MSISIVGSELWEIPEEIPGETWFRAEEGDAGPNPPSEDRLCRMRLCPPKSGCRLVRSQRVGGGPQTRRSGERVGNVSGRGPWVHLANAVDTRRAMCGRVVGRGGGWRRGRGEAAPRLARG